MQQERWSCSQVASSCTSKAEGEGGRRCCAPLGSPFRRRSWSETKGSCSCSGACGEAGVWSCVFLQEAGPAFGKDPPFVLRSSVHISFKLPSGKGACGKGECLAGPTWKSSSLGCARAHSFPVFLFPSVWGLGLEPVWMRPLVGRAAPERWAAVVSESLLLFLVGLKGGRGVPRRGDLGVPHARKLVEVYPSHARGPVKDITPQIPASLPGLSQLQHHASTATNDYRAGLNPPPPLQITYTQGHPIIRFPCLTSIIAVFFYSPYKIRKLEMFLACSFFFPFSTCRALNISGPFLGHRIPR